jgi:hypothetical protein
VRNKLRVIDVSILSSYMGKSLTVFVTLFVLGITVAALIDGGGVERDIIRVCVPAGEARGRAIRQLEPLRSLLGRQTHRPVILVECTGEWPQGCDVYVMPVDEFFRWEERLGVAVVHEIGSSERPHDRAVIVAQRSAEVVDTTSMTPGDVVYAHPASVNAFWVQADALSPPGGEWAAGTHLEFRGARDNATLVICGVALGVFDLGACKVSEIAALSAQDVVDGGELRVVFSADALPERVIAVSRGEERYYGSKLSSIAELLENESSRADHRDSVRLLKAAGVRRIDRMTPDRLARVRALYDRFDAFSRDKAGGGPQDP